jgi:cytochrome P450
MGTKFVPTKWSSFNDDHLVGTRFHNYFPFLFLLLTHQLSVWATSRRMLSFFALFDSSLINTLQQVQEYEAITLNTVLAGSMSSILYYFYRQRKASSPMKKIPEPSTTVPFIKNTLDLIRNGDRVHDWLAEQSENFNGQPWKYHVVGQTPSIVLTSPETWEEVMKERFEDFPKGEHTHEQVSDLVGNSLIGMDGVKWLHQRKTITRLLTRRSLKEYMTDIVHDHTRILLDLLLNAKGGQVDLANLFKRFSMETFAKISFGVELGCLTSQEPKPFEQALDSALTILMSRFMAPTWWWKLKRYLNIGDEAEFKKNVQVIDDTIYKVIGESFNKKKQKRGSQEGEEEEEANQPADIITLFTQEMDEKDQTDPKFLRDVAFTMIIAGRDTVGESLAWFFVHLSHHPSVEEKIRRELKEQLPRLFDTSAPIQPPTFDECQSLVYLEACINEALRLHPSGAFLRRFAAKDSTLKDGTFIAKDTTIVIPPYAMGRLTSLWGKNALEYLPERWLEDDGKTVKNVSSFIFTVFGAGPRQCPGKNFSIMEIKMLVSSLIARCHFERVFPAMDKPVDYAMTLTLTLKNPFVMIPHPVIES